MQLPNVRATHALASLQPLQCAQGDSRTVERRLEMKYLQLEVSGLHKPLAMPREPARHGTDALRESSASLMLAEPGPSPRGG